MFFPLAFGSGSRAKKRREKYCKNLKFRTKCGMINKNAKERLAGKNILHDKVTERIISSEK